jgi:hypothetical protein
MPQGGATLFSFGYWGAGSSTRALVEGVNEAEALRGYEPPLWVDIRISRSVRAAGFRDSAFEKLLGSNYAWMPDLGNLCAQESRPGIEIKNPAAAGALLDHALQDDRRRAIFFCACGEPAGCHRYAVGKLVKKAAMKRGVDVTVVEWPGGEPSKEVLELAVPRAVLRGVQSGRVSIPIPEGMPLGQAASIPWGSRALLKAGDEELELLVGPARFSSRGANIEWLGAPDEGASLRKKHGYNALK